MTILEALVLQLFLGGPVFLLAVGIESIGLLRWKHMSIRQWKFWGVLGLSFVTTVVLSLTIWVFWSFQFDIMFLEVINVPALAAALVALPLALSLTRQMTPSAPSNRVSKERDS